MNTNSDHREQPQPPTQELADAIGGCLEFCDTHTGHNLPDLLSAALRSIANERGGSWALTVHRPGCWEPTHVEALAAGADHHLELDAEPKEPQHLMTPTQQTARGAHHKIGGTDPMAPVPERASLGAPAVRRHNPANTPPPTEQDDTGSRPARTQVPPPPVFTANTPRPLTALTNRTTASETTPHTRSSPSAVENEPTSEEHGPPSQAHRSSSTAGTATSHGPASAKPANCYDHCFPFRDGGRGRSPEGPPAGRPCAGWFPNNHPPLLPRLSSRTPNHTQAACWRLGNGETCLPPERKDIAWL